VNEDQGVYVVGAGGHAKVVVSTLQAAGYSVKAIFDDDSRKWGVRLSSIPVEGPTAEVERLERARVVLAIGDNATRRALSKRLQGADWVTAVHPDAFVHPSVRLGPGAVVFAGAVIQPDTVVGAHGIINTGATIDHDCVIGSCAHVAPGTHLGGDVRLGEGVFLGIGSSVIPGVEIDRWAVVGAGGVVVNDLPAGVVATGVPAKPLERDRHA
jgi:UDP-perosamine 4-acetyltransferase